MNEPREMETSQREGEHGDNDDDKEECTNDELSLSSGATIPIYARVVEHDSTIYRDRYTIELPKTEDGFMINLRGTVTDEPFVEEYYAAFGGYYVRSHFLLLDHFLLM